MSNIIKCESEKEAITLSLSMNKEDSTAMWLFGFDREHGWFIENWRELNKEGN